MIDTENTYQLLSLTNVWRSSSSLIATPLAMSFAGVLRRSRHRGWFSNSSSELAFNVISVEYKDCLMHRAAKENMYFNSALVQRSRILSCMRWCMEMVLLVIVLDMRLLASNFASKLYHLDKVSMTHYNADEYPLKVMFNDSDFIRNKLDELHSHAVWIEHTQDSQQFHSRFTHLRECKRPCSVYKMMIWFHCWSKLCSESSWSSFTHSKEPFHSYCPSLYAYRHLYQGEWEAPCYFGLL